MWHRKKKPEKAEKPKKTKPHKKEKTPQEEVSDWMGIPAMSHKGKPLARESLIKQSQASDKKGCAVGVQVLLARLPGHFSDKRYRRLIRACLKKLRKDLK